MMVFHRTEETIRIYFSIFKLFSHLSLSGRYVQKQHLQFCDYAIYFNWLLKSKYFSPYCSNLNMGKHRSSQKHKVEHSVDMAVLISGSKLLASLRKAKEN